MNLAAKLGFIWALASLKVVQGQNSTFCEGDYLVVCPANNHVACETHFLTRLQCPEDVQVIDLSGLKDWIVDLHNYYRNLLAGGLVANNQSQLFPPAQRMPTVVWNDMLAYFAQSNANTCKFGHSKCRKSMEFEWAGENLGFSSGIENTTEAIQDLIANWWNEYLLAGLQDIASFSSLSKVGHFTAMAQDRTDQVGCGGVIFDESSVLFVCVYAFTNIRDVRVYEAGEATSGCILGPSSVYPNLCSTEEPIIASPYVE